jgi:hypothetical protein
VLGTGALRPLLRLGPVALCALTAHAALYRSLLPRDGAHGYLCWYEPAIALLSIGSAATVGIAAVAALLGRRSRTLATIRTAEQDSASALRLASLAVVWLVVQETVERSVGAGHFEPAAVAGGGWPIVVVVAAGAACVLTLLSRVGAAVANALAKQPPRIAARPQVVKRLIRRVVPRRRRALADRRGLRAPPVTP